MFGPSFANNSWQSALQRLVKMVESSLLPVTSTL